MTTKKKFANESFVIMTEMVLPNDTNTLNNLMGGRLMHWMDIVSAISAQRHANSTVVTASADNISFSKPINLGDVVTLKAQVTRAFNSSMEVHVTVSAENLPKGTKQETHSAFFTFVAVDKENNKLQVPELITETAEEKVLFDGALRRRQLRLILSKRMQPKDATELKALFDLV